MTVPQALAVKEELEKIDELLKQLEEARKTARIGIIDMDLLAEFAEPGDIDQLSALQQQIQDYLRELAEQQGSSRRPAASASRPRPTACSRASCWSGCFRNWPRRAPAGTRGRSSAKAPSSCRPPSHTSSATRSPTSTSRHVRQRARAQRSRLARAIQRRRHPGPPHAQHAQVRHLRAHGHERLDALRRPVHQRQAHGPGARRPHPPRLPRRLAAIRRDVHVRQAGRARPDRRPDAQAGDAVTIRSCG